MFNDTSDLANPPPVVVTQSSTRCLRLGYKIWIDVRKKSSRKKKPPKPTMTTDPAYERVNNSLR